MTPIESPICLAVLNPGGRDAPVDYASGPGSPDAPGHPPVNFHGYAAATKGAFFDRVGAVLAQADRFDAVLVLIRSRLGASLRAVRQLRSAGLPVLVSWKEAGPGQIAAQLRTRRSLQLYAEILDRADGVLSPTTVLPPWWGSRPVESFARKTRFLPTPYPVEYPEWDFQVDPADREGILLGTRQFLVPARNHQLALSRSAALAEDLDIPVTVINGDKRTGRGLLDEWSRGFPGSRLRVIDRPLRYDRYLALMASHRVVFQLDRSHVPGQVAGDAALCRTLCVGGNSALETVVFPEWADDGSGKIEASVDRIRELFRDPHAYRQALTRAETLAKEKAGYRAVAEQLAAFLGDLARGSG